MNILIDEHIWDFDLDAALKEISSQRREQALKFKFEQGQRLSVLAYLLLKRGLRESFGITDNPLFAYNQHGKPSIVGHPDIYFNISHCKEAVACAIDSRPVGIDVEAFHEYRSGLARYTMNDDELSGIEKAADPSRPFIRLWTMKEATVKLLGSGISHDIKNVIDKNRFHYTTVERQSYIYTVAQYHEDNSGKRGL